MKILIDMNLSPEWVLEFQNHGIEAVHWSTIGSLDAPDTDLMKWARQFDYIIFTHDLDFGTLLALTGAEKHSVIQIRTQDVTVKKNGKSIITTITKYRDYLEQGALIVLDEAKGRLRILPFN